MSIKQFTYTASPWGVNAPGWTVFQYTVGFEPAIASTFKAYYTYENLKGVEKSPIKLTFVGKESHGLTVLSQVCDCGLRWWDTSRGKNYFSHVYLGDATNAFDELNMSFNPMAWYGSKCFQVDQKDFSSQVKKAGENSIAPKLDVLPEMTGLQKLDINLELEDIKLFGRYDNGGKGNWSKIGAIVDWMYRRMNGEEGEPLVFDARKREGIDAMALGLRLLPFATRKQVVFSTWLTSSEMSAFPEGNQLLFYGTIYEGETADPDTGLYGKKSSLRGLDFTSREDTRLFQQIVDAGGQELNSGDFDNLVICWRVAAGREMDDIDKLRKAMEFSKKFSNVSQHNIYPVVQNTRKNNDNGNAFLDAVHKKRDMLPEKQYDMRDLIQTGIANVYKQQYDGVQPSGIPNKIKIIFAMAYFELGMKAFEEKAKQVCKESVHDIKLFDNVFQELRKQKQENHACTKFLEEFDKVGKANFVNEFMKSQINIGEDSIEDRSFRETFDNNLLFLSLNYRDIKNGKFSGDVSEQLKILYNLYQKFPNAEQEINGFSQLKNYLESLLRNKNDNSNDQFEEDSVKKNSKLHSFLFAVIAFVIAIALAIELFFIWKYGCKIWKIMSRNGIYSQWLVIKPKAKTDNIKLEEEDSRQSTVEEISDEDTRRNPQLSKRPPRRNQ